MNRTAAPAPLALTVPGVLRAAATAYRTGALAWGQDSFTTPTGCRCVLGALTWVLDPAAITGPSDLADPASRRAGEAAMDLLAELLVADFGAADRGERGYWGDWVRNPIETVGDWNDDPARTLDEVLYVLDAAAEQAVRVAS